jgi:hypothetical protein
VEGANLELDTKLQVLFAIYAEYQKDVPDMNEITFKRLDMDKAAFNVALVKLENEGLISELVAAPPNSFRHPVQAIVTGVFPTREGLERVETKLEIEKSETGEEKLRTLVERFGKLGWDVLRGVAVSVLSKAVR